MTAPAYLNTGRLDTRTTKVRPGLHSKIQAKKNKTKQEEVEEEGEVEREEEKGEKERKK